MWEEFKRRLKKNLQWYFWIVAATLCVWELVKVIKDVRTHSANSVWDILGIALGVCVIMVENYVRGKKSDHSGVANRLLVVIGAAILMAITKPSLSDYSQWLSGRIQADQPTFAGELKSALLFNPDAIAHSTSDTNLVVLSIYETDIDNQRIIVIGAFQHFFPITGGTIQPNSK